MHASVHWSTLVALAPFVVFFGVAALAFRYPLLAGYRWIGNSDRWNQYLLFVQFHTYSLNAGTFRAWSGNLTDGFDILAQPFSFFSPWFLLPTLFHTSDVVAVFAYVDFAFLALTLGVSYWVIQRLTHDRLASFAGACIYGCSTYSLLKLSQNDTTYLTIVVAPIMFFLVHTACREHRLRTIALLTAIVAYCVYSAFLQEFSYVLLFLGLYAVWRAFHAQRESLIAFAASLAAGVIIGLPRLLVQFQTLTDTPRISSGVVFDGDVFTILRYFSRDIYGRSAAESLLGPSVNLYEGDLLFAAGFASLLLVAILIDRGRRARTPWSALRASDIGFFVAYIIFVFATMHLEFVYRVVSVAYAGIPFQHSRIGVSALLPVALLSALYLRRRSSERLRPSAWVTIGVLLGLVVVASTFDYERWRDPFLSALGQPAGPFLTCDACATLK
ncbi:MAG: hypothetical protein JO057_32020, partial [Chloroflexi bacterium]|nr:hypothetical protein [Chloroflexota bacterium]